MISNEHYGNFLARSFKSKLEAIFTNFFVKLFFIIQRRRLGDSKSVKGFELVSNTRDSPPD